MAVLKAICISEKKGTAKLPVEKAHLVKQYGLQKDAHAGKWHRQVSLLSYQTIEAFRAQGAEVEDGAFGENLIVDGLEDLKSLPLGTRFRIGETILELSQIGKECHSHCAIFEQVGTCIMPREGVFAVVLQGGEIQVGDPVTTTPPNLYRMLMEECDNSESVLAKVIAGDHAGETLFFLDHIPRYYRGASSDFRQSELWTRREEIMGLERTGILKAGEEEIFVEKVGTQPKLVICGGGHVSCALVKAALPLGFHITVLEDRPYFAGLAKQAGADEVLCDAFQNSLEQIPSDADTYFVIATRGHRFDRECLEIILNKPKAYMGMMGSRGRIALLKQEIIQNGFLPELVDELHAPIGLAIGAQTPEEIAVSIAAELILEKRKARKAIQQNPEVLKHLNAVHEGEKAKAVLCTILEKRGSAPREAGTKMLVGADGTITGTIGGGCMEAEVIGKCRDMLADGTQTKRMTVRMIAEEAQEEGLVCGGTVELFLEEVCSGESL